MSDEQEDYPTLGGGPMYYDAITNTWPRHPGATEPEALWLKGRLTAIRIADHSRRHEYAFHWDGEPCMVAMTSRQCPENHHYGRTFEESR